MLQKGVFSTCKYSTFYLYIYLYLSIISVNHAWIHYIPKLFEFSSFSDVSPKTTFISLLSWTYHLYSFSDFHVIFFYISFVVAIGYQFHLLIMYDCPQHSTLVLSNSGGLGLAETKSDQRLLFAAPPHPILLSSCLCRLVWGGGPIITWWTSKSTWSFIYI